MSYSNVPDSVAHFDNNVNLPLPNGDYVMYNRNGSGKPIVLSGVALEVYRCLTNGIPTDIVRMSHPELEKTWDENLRTMVEFFSQERLVSSVVGTTSIRAPTSKPRKFIALWIHVTDACNLRCSYCYVRKGKRHLTEKTCHEIVDALQCDVTYGGVTEIELRFAGGEPLANFGVVTYLSQLAKQTFEPQGVKVRLDIVTNATLVTDRIADTLKSMGFRVMVSLDGLGEYNDARRFVNGRVSAARVLRGLDILTRVGIRPTVLTTISDQSVQGLWDLSRFLASRNLQLSLSLSRDYKAPQGLTMNAGLVGASTVEFLNRVTRLPDAELPKISFNGVVFAGRRSSICSAGRNFYAVDPVGNVCFCQMTIDKPLGSVSNGRGILEFSGEVDKMTKGGECIECTWGDVCCSGCGVLAEQAGTTGRASVMCSLMKQILPSILTYEGRKIQKEQVKLP
jgi:uncharacterized protein